MKNKNSGFTLIEILIYALLLTGILTFAILIVYQMITYSERGRYERQLVEAQIILEQKIFWALQSVAAINYPAPGATSTVISINKLNYAENPVIIDVLASTTARLKRGATAAQPLTPDTVAVTDLTFYQSNVAGHNAIRVSGTLYNPYASSSKSFLNTIIFK